MKLSFSTRGWKNTSWQEQLKDAADLHFQGIEFYNIHECEHLMDRNGPFHVYHQHDSIRDLRERGLSIPCLDTSLDLSLSDFPLSTAFDLMKIARNMRIPYLAFCVMHNDESIVSEHLSESTIPIVTITKYRTPPSATWAAMYGMFIFVTPMMICPIISLEKELFRCRMS